MAKHRTTAERRKIVAAWRASGLSASENEVLKRRLYGTKSERGGTHERLAPAPAPPTVEKPRPKGRRDLSASSLPKILVEIRDAELEKTGKLIDWDVSYQLMRQRGGFKVLVKKTAKYEVTVGDKKTVHHARRLALGERRHFVLVKSRAPLRLGARGWRAGRCAELCPGRRSHSTHVVVPGTFAGISREITARHEA